MSIEKRPFGTTRLGERASLWDLEAGAFRVTMSDFGATLVSWLVPAEGGGRDDILLGHDDLGSWEASTAYFGATVGRYANRIARGRFSLDGKIYSLAINNGVNHLHGGLVGFDRRVWKAEPFEAPGLAGLRFELESPDGEEGYPGNLRVRASYSISRSGDLEIVYEAQCDAATVLGLTQHAYFNLGGEGRRDILDHELMLAASRYLPVDSGQIPSGALKPVANGPFDFLRPKPLGRDIGAAGDYDHCFVIDRAEGEEGLFVEFADLRDPQSGRRLRAATTLPGVQLYTGNFLEGIRGKGGRIYHKHGGLCLETEVYPDSPNHPDFPGAILRPGEVWKHKTRYSFESSLAL